MLSDQDIAAIRSGVGAYQAAVERVRADKRLSPDGKAGQIGRLTALERRRRSDIIEGAAERATARRAELERQVFRLPAGANASDAVSYRDALDRVEQITNPEELGRLVDRAVRTGDAALARAGVARGYAKYNAGRSARHGNQLGQGEAWRKAAAIGLADASDQERAAFRELDELDAAAGNRDARMRTSMHGSVPTPPELSHLMAHQIDAMADAPALTDG